MISIAILPVIATSGVDYDIKLWEPVDAKVCSLDDASKVGLIYRARLEPAGLRHPILLHVEREGSG